MALLPIREQKWIYTNGSISCNFQVETATYYLERPVQTPNEIDDSLFENILAYAKTLFSLGGYTNKTVAIYKPREEN